MTRRSIDVRPAATRDERDPSARAYDEAVPGLGRVFGSIVCVVVVLLAVALEVVAGQAANSPEAAHYARLIPLGWPQPVRALWWALIAAVAAAHRLLLDERRGLRRHLLAALAASPFVVFAGGIASGASWSTWN